MKIPSNPPDRESKPGNGLLPDVQVTDDRRVLIDDVVLPGTWIEKHGVKIERGGDRTINRLTVTFLVGDIDVDESVVGEIRT